METTTARTPRTLEEARWLDEEATVSRTVLVPLCVPFDDETQWTVETERP